MAKKPPTARWARRHFGPGAADLRSAVSGALARAHMRALAAHEAGEMTDRDTYGTTLHVAQYEELARALNSWPGATVTRLGRHPLVIINGLVLYPWRYSADGNRPLSQARLRLPVSNRRTRLFKAHGPAPMQPALDPSFEPPTPAELLEAFPELGQGTRLVLIAYACSVDAGVMHRYWGEAELRDRGGVVWHNGEVIPAPTTHQHPPAQGEGGGLTLVSPRPTNPPSGGGRFYDGDLPELTFPVHPRKVNEPSSEAEPDTDGVGQDEKK